MKLLLAAAALLPGCVMPGTRATFAWDPRAQRFEGTLDRSWLAGPVDLDLTAVGPDGVRVELHWHSNASTKDAADASKAQSAALQAAAQAGIELGKAAVNPIPK